MLDENSLRELVSAKEFRLRFLKLQQARQGYDTPAQINMEIVDVEQQLQELHEQLVQPSEEDKSVQGRLAKLQGEYDSLTRRIAALDTDIARTVSSLETLVLVEKRAAFEQEREELVQTMIALDIQQEGTHAPRSSTSLNPLEQHHLQLRLAERQNRYGVLTKRIAAMDWDIGLEIDSERKLVLNERRSDLATQRNLEVDELEKIERRLSL